jgi:hypothetical protein
LTWPEVLSLWRKGLEGLVQEFCSGHCPVRPTRPDYCSFCDLSPLCRLAEQRRRLKGSGPCGLD